MIARIQTIIQNKEHRKKRAPQNAIEVFFNGKTHRIPDNPYQIIDLLFSTYENAELMDGDIGVVTEEGSGATFWFTAVFEKDDSHPPVRTKCRIA